MGVGSEEALIRVEVVGSAPEEENDAADVARGVLEMLLSMMGVVASIVSPDQPSAEGDDATPVVFDVQGDDLGILIGHRGQTLSCLQYIVRLIVGHQVENWAPIIIDVEGYKQRRYEALRGLAWRVAEQVKTDQVPFTLEPMAPYERRIVHLTLAEHSDVITESIGEGEARKVVILPNEQSV